MGNLTQNEARPVGHLTFVSKCWSAGRSAVGNKRILQFFHSAHAPRSRVIALVDSTWVFHLLSFYVFILWKYMPLFKVWSEDKLKKKFVVAENLQNLFPKVSDSVIHLFHARMARQNAACNEWSGRLNFSFFWRSSLFTYKHRWIIILINTCRKTTSAFLFWPILVIHTYIYVHFIEHPWKGFFSINCNCNETIAFNLKKAWTYL